MNSTPPRQPVGRAVRAAVLVCPVLLCSAAVVEAKVSYTTFQVSNDSTTVAAMNQNGDTTGFYNDSSGTAHPFIRSAAGTITTFDVSASGSFGVGIDNAGDVTGTYLDGGGSPHGFVRTPDGTITKFDAATGATTVPQAINIDGTIAGYYTTDMPHGFVRTADGTVRTFDVSNEPGGTKSFAINDKGEIAGAAFNAEEVSESFLRTRGGKIVTFAAASGMGVNARGTIAGSVEASNFEGFSRAKNGTLTTFEAPGAGTLPNQGTFGQSVNKSGEISGEYSDNNSVFHGFVRSASGKLTSFDAPGAGTRTRQGTLPIAINDSGVVAGSYIDPENGSHGFIRTP